jgi:hypothetical protein
LSRPFANVCDRKVSGRVFLSFFERSHLGSEKPNRCCRSSPAAVGAAAYALCILA